MCRKSDIPAPIAIDEKFATSLSKEIAVHHLIHAIPAKTHTPMYYMHKYWARKPHNVVAEYISTYSKKGEIVLDPFAGSGVTVIEAIKQGRRAISVDFDPVSCFITKQTAAYVDLDKLRRTYKEIEKRIKKKINDLYQTKCKRCEKFATLSHVVWKSEGKDKEVPIEEWYYCTCIRDLQHKKIDSIDRRIVSSLDKSNIRSWYPRNELVWNSRINVSRGKSIPEFFTKRNLKAVSMLYNEIEKIKDKSVRELMKFVFTGFLMKSTRMNLAMRKTSGSRSLGRGWCVRGYWVPADHMEQNVWNDFASQFEHVLKGKEESNELLEGTQLVRTFADLKNEGDLLILNRSVLDLSVIPENSIDYVFTDPPYGDSVPYGELHYMWASWLKFNVDLTDEIIISDSPVRKEKNFEMYDKMLRAAFNQIYRVLKPARWMTVTFHNTDIQIYNCIIRAAILSGFELEKIIYQPPAMPSAKGAAAPYASAIGDYYIRFKKPFNDSEKVSEEEIDKERFVRIVVEAIKKIIAERGEPTPYSLIVNSYAEIYQKLKEHGYLFSASKGIDEILHERLDKDFVLADGKWWFKDPSVIPHLEHVPLHERVERSVLEVLNKKVKVSFDDVLKEIFVRFPNALTPEVSSIKNVLEEYAEKTKDRMWILKPSVKNDISMHDQIVEKLAMLGKRLGYGVHADIEGWREYALPFHETIPRENLSRIERIDCIWHNNEKILYDFEVEHSTGITEAIVRGSNIPYRTKKFIIIPAERENKLVKKVAEPFIKDRLKDDNWGFIRYHDFLAFYDDKIRKKDIDVAELEKLDKLPAKQRQADITEYLNSR